MRILISLVVLIIVIASVGFERLWAVLSSVNLGWFVVALAIHMAGIVIRTFRWAILVESLEVRVSFGRLFYLYMAGTFFNTFLPTGIGGDVVKIIESGAGQRRGAGVQHGLRRSVDRHSWHFVGRPVRGDHRSGGCAAAGSRAGHFCHRRNPGGHAAAYAAAADRSSDAPRAGLVEIAGERQGAADLRALTSYSPGAIARSTLISLPFTLTLIAAQYALALSLGVKVPVQYFALFIPLIALVQLLPISFNGLGVREVTFQALFGTVGVAGEQAVAISLLYYTLRVITGLIGGLMYLVGNVRTARRESAPETAAPAGPLER